MVAQAGILAPPKPELVREAAEILDTTLRDLDRQERERLAAVGVSEPPRPTCKLYEEWAALLRSHIFRLEATRSPRAIADVRGRLETLRRDLNEHLIRLEPHYRQDDERDMNLAGEYWRCAMTESSVRRTLDEDWVFLEDCIRGEQQVEARWPSQREWLKKLPPEERTWRRRMDKEGLLIRPPFTAAEKQERTCHLAVARLTQCCPKVPIKEPVAEEWEAARLASRHGIPLDEARRLLWKEARIVESLLLEEEE